MNSLQELNDFSNEYVEFDDQRPTAIKYSFDTASAKTVSISEGETHYAQIGIDITELVNCRAGNVIYRIDLSQANATANFGTLPANVTANVSSPGVYNINGLIHSPDWETIKSPLITMPVDFANNWSYTSTIFLDGNVSQSWITSVSVTNLPEITTPTSMYYFNSNVDQTVTGYPQILDTTSNSYTLTISPSIPSFVSNLMSYGTGGNVTSNVTTKAVTITGSNVQVNGYLANTHFTISSTASIDFSLDYKLVNGTSGFISNISQQIVNGNLSLMTLGSSSFYDEDITGNITNTPSVVDLLANGNGTYSLTITSTESNCISDLASNATSGTSSFNSGTKTLTITGNRLEVNARLANLTLTPYIDKRSDFYLRYTLVTPYTGKTVVRNQPLVIRNTNSPVSNIAVTRSYVQNTPDYLFTANIPSINEPTANTTVYTINLSSDYGAFGLGDSNLYNSYSFTGTKIDVNAHFSLIKFYPIKDVYGSGTITYKQYYVPDNLLQTTSTIPIEGALRTEPLPDEATYTWYDYTGGTALNVFFTPTIYQARYLKMDILLVGGGGGGNGYWPNWGAPGGGGAVVEYINWNTPTRMTLSSKPYRIAVGLGGHPGAGDRVRYTFETGLPYDQYPYGLSGSGSLLFGTYAGTVGGLPAYSYVLSAAGGLGGGVTQYTGAASGSGFAGGTVPSFYGYSAPNVSGGGGGAGGVGENAEYVGPNTHKGGKGGVGILSTVTGEWYGGGGGGNGNTANIANIALGGSSVGGSGANGNTAGGNALLHHGGGGGGGGSKGGLGASGFILIRFYR